MFILPLMLRGTALDDVLEWQPAGVALRPGVWPAQPPHRHRPHAATLAQVNLHPLRHELTLCRNTKHWFYYICNTTQWFYYICNTIQWFSYICNTIQWFYISVTQYSGFIISVTQHSGFIISEHNTVVLLYL